MIMIYFHLVIIRPIVEKKEHRVVALVVVSNKAMLNVTTLIGFSLSLSLSLSHPLSLPSLSLSLSLSPSLPPTHRLFVMSPR